MTVNGGQGAVPHDGEGQEPNLPSARFVALLDSQPLPSFTYGPGGRQLMCNSSAVRLLTSAPDGDKRVLAVDGTDLWTIIAGRADGGNTFFDIRLRLRVASGESLETTMLVAPLRATGGLLGGAIVFVLSIPAERIQPLKSERRQPDEHIQEIIARLGVLVGANRVLVLEVDPDFGTEAKVLSSWSVDGDDLRVASIDLKGTPAEAVGSRRMTCVPSGLAAAYPSVPLIAKGEFESYVGVALSNPAGGQIGILAGVWGEPIEDVPGVCATFSITAARVTEILVSMMAERELRESEQRYGAVFEGSAVPILLVEPVTTQLVDANPAACTYYGYSRDELLSMSVLQLDVLSVEDSRAELERALEGPRRSFIGRHLLAGGRVRDVEVHIGSIRVVGRRLLYLMVNDITERKRMEAEIENNRRNLTRIVGQRTEDLLRANAELQQASMARDMVFVTLAQELRTSLQTITGFSDLLLGGMSGDLTAEQRKQIEMMQQAARRLTTFSATLVESQRLEEKGFACEPEDFDLVGLAESVVFGLGSFALDKGLTLALVAEERPLPVRTDRYKVQEILLNLLSNAVRYTERGGVTVTVSSSEGDRLVAVADTGPGLSQERVDRLFDGPEMHGSAAGIGLPASRRIAGLLGGAIEVQSVPGRGSVFTLRMPEICPCNEAGCGE
ncbi:MAG: PAS domain S-box protein [Coriobacteriia bacterium]|nr:PAS domain S-box protein [Coriobacteriia bacterium]